ncbi:MAG TPA: Motility protein FimV, partial [Gammaproteobacteria bacterium]
MRSLARGFAALILLLPVNSHALGLGDIEVHSALNQPLDAEISLLSAESVSLQEINVELASIDAFAQAQVERPVFLTKIKF